VTGGLFLGLDAVRLLIETQSDQTVLVRIATLLPYLPLLLALYTYGRGWPFYRPLARWANPRLTPVEGDERILRDTVLPALPLIIGAGGAWTAGVLWNEYIRPEGKAIHAGVTPEFFAQMSAVIPVLLLALVIETRVLRASTSVPRPRRELNIYVVVVLVLGEAMAISALPVSNDDGEGNELVLGGWHEYIAFNLSVFAVGVALATILLLAAGVLQDEEPEPLTVKVVD
jgi:hypothetical protein